MGFRITNKDGSRLVVTNAENEDLTTNVEKVLPISAPLYSLFRDMKIFWNQTSVFYSDFMYPWYADYVLKVKMPQAQRKALYQSVRYYNDSGDLQSAYRSNPTTKMVDLVGYDGEGTIPLWEDQAYTFGESKYMEVAGPLLHDLQFQSKLLHDDINIRIEMTLAKPEFSLFASTIGKKYFVQLEKAVCVVPRVTIGPEALSLTRSLETDYYFVQHDLTIHVIPKDTLNFSKQVASGTVPRRLWFLMVKEQAYNGTYTLSPFTMDTMISILFSCMLVVTKNFHTNE